MTWEWFNTAAGAASLMGLVLAAVLGLVSWRISRSTNALISAGDDRTQALMAQGTAQTQDTLRRLGEILAQMEADAELRHQEMKDRLEGEQPR